MANQSILKRFDVWILYALLLITPTFILGIKSLHVNAYAVDYFKATAYFLSSYLIFITVIGYYIKRPYVTLFFGCHDRCDRRFHVIHHLLPICSRCTGIFVGIFLSIVLSYFNLPFYIYLILGIPLLIDGYIQFLGILSNQKRRFITGVLFGPSIVFMFGLYNITIVFILKSLTDLLIF